MSETGGMRTEPLISHKEKRFLEALRGCRGGLSENVNIEFVLERANHQRQMLLMSTDMRLPYALLLFAISFCVTSANAADRSAITAGLEPDFLGSMHELQTSETELNKAFHALKAATPAEARKALGKAHSSWLKYRNDECALVIATVANKDVKPFIQRLCLVGHNRMRVRHLLQSTNYLSKKHSKTSNQVP